jgi:hypothetical protein
MGVLGGLFTRHSVSWREPRDTTNDALNAGLGFAPQPCSRFQRNYQYELGIHRGSRSERCMCCERPPSLTSSLTGLMPALVVTRNPP